MMVKTLDKKEYPQLEDHIGWRLWRVSELWKKRFDAEMSVLGHYYFAEARGNVIRHIGHNGTTQTTIVQGMGISKQAVQQLIDELEMEGVVKRKVDPADKRGKLVTLTQKGIIALHDAKLIKKKIEADYKKLLGSKRLDDLNQGLDDLTALILQLPNHK